MNALLISSNDTHKKRRDYRFIFRKSRSAFSFIVIKIFFSTSHQVFFKYRETKYLVLKILAEIVSCYIKQLSLERKKRVSDDERTFFFFVCLQSCLNLFITTPQCLKS